MNTVPSDKSVILITLMRMTDSCACECHRNRGFSHRYRFKRQTTFSEEYRTLRQERLPRPVSLNTVPADKSIPYSPTKNTVLSHKLYRTLRQGIPYPPTRNTVLPDKEYRTPRQGIPYSAAKHSVLSNKWCA